MALAPLATATDLSDRGIDTDDIAAVAAFLASASEAVRSAAGCSISELTATVALEGDSSRWLQLPGWAITSVDEVDIDGTVVTDARLASGRLWRRCGWQADCGPALVTVTYTQGLTEVPADIVDLVCSLVGAALAAMTDGGYAANTGLQYESIDDYRVGYATGNDAVASVMELPARTKQSLAERFGSAVAVTGTYS